MKKIVVIVPCYNEEESLLYLLDALEQQQKELAKKYRLDILLVNDGSRDNTQNIIAAYASTHEDVYYREFLANAGHQSAIRAGIDAAAHYDAAIMLDADMQHPPELIPTMVDAWEKGAAVVQMIRTDNAKDAGFFKYTTSKLYYKLINGLSNIQLEYGASDFRLIDKSIVKLVADSHERDLFLRGYFSWLRVPSVSIGYKPNKRIAGKSKYSLRKMLDLGVKGILQFSERPLKISMIAGNVLALASVLYGLYLIASYFLGGDAISGWTSLMVVVLFCFGVNFVLIGIVGSYLAQSIRIQKQRPDYIIGNEKLPTN